MTDASEIPLALAFPSPSGKTWIVPICPICGEEHSHGPEPGVRVGHCVGRLNPIYDVQLLENLERD